MKQLDISLLSSQITSHGHVIKTGCLPSNPLEMHEDWAFLLLTPGFLFGGNRSKSEGHEGMRLVRMSLEMDRSRAPVFQLCVSTHSNFYISIFFLK